MEYKKKLFESFENTNNKYLLLDTETDRLETDTAHILQISFIIADHEFKEYIEMYDTLIDVGNISITNSYCHGITNDMCNKKGISIVETLEILYEYLTFCTHLIIYNYKFDIAVLNTELERFQNRDLAELANKIRKELDSKIIICPMRELSGLININNNSRAHKLSENYEAVLSKKITNAHNSKYDVLNMLEMLKYIYDNKDHFLNKPLDYKMLPLAELKKICKSKGIKKYSTKRKEELINMLFEFDSL